MNRGGYPETLDAGLSSIAEGRQPTLLQVYEAGTATIAEAEGMTVPIRTVLARAGVAFEPERYLPLITSYFSSVDGELQSLPYNVSTPVLYANLGALGEAGLDDSVALRTWDDVEAVLRTLRDRGEDCPMTTSWPSWIHLENYSAVHDLPFATPDNGFGAAAPGLVFDDAARIAHIARLGAWRRDGLFV